MTIGAVEPGTMACTPFPVTITRGENTSTLGGGGAAAAMTTPSVATVAPLFLAWLEDHGTRSQGVYVGR